MLHAIRTSLCPYGNVSSSQNELFGHVASILDCGVRNYDRTWLLFPCRQPSIAWLSVPDRARLPSLEVLEVIRLELSLDGQAPSRHSLQGHAIDAAADDEEDVPAEVEDDFFLADDDGLAADGPALGVDDGPAVDAGHAVSGHARAGNVCSAARLGLPAVPEEGAGGHGCVSGDTVHKLEGLAVAGGERWVAGGERTASGGGAIACCSSEVSCSSPERSSSAELAAAADAAILAAHPLCTKVHDWFERAPSLRKVKISSSICTRHRCCAC